jgi:tetratricopeptide (TPR) repeat protein
VLQAVSFFQRAIERDSMFARAHAGLSDAYARLGAFGYGAPRQEFPRALAAAQRALALDSTLGEAHAALAHVLFVYEWDTKRSEEAYRRAIALDPRYSFARFSFAVLLQGQGRFDEAIAQLDTARMTDPLAPAVPNVLGRVYVSARQPDSAIRHLREALVLNPRLDLAHQQLGNAYLQKGMRQEAIDAFRAGAAISGPRDSAHLAYAYAIDGQRAEALRVLRRVLVRSDRRYVSPYAIAIAYAGLGDDDETFRWLDRAYDERALFAVGMDVEQAFAGLHEDPRWTQLLHRVGSSQGAGDARE